MITPVREPARWRRQGIPLSAATFALVIGLSACGGSSSNKTASSTAGGSSTTAAPSASSNPGTSFSTANVAGVGTVVVDARGHTVYLLTSGNHTNVPCDDASGCTKVWPDLPLPEGTTAATAGSGIQSSMLSTMKLSDGESYPTYNGWLMYEYTGDTGPAQAHGQGIQSFGGTWWTLSPSGMPITTTAASTSSSSTGATPGY